MDRMIGARLLELVHRCIQVVNESGQAVGGSSEKSLALYQLHSAAILGAAVSYIAAPVWRDNRDLSDESGADPVVVYRMSSEAIAAVLGAFESVRKIMDEAGSLIEGAELPDGERSAYKDGLRKVIAYVDEAMDVISRQRGDE